MSLSTILSTASSGMMAAQAGIRTVSDNIANANTPGYVRKVVNQTSLVSQGAGAGVNIEGVARVVDRYLQSASLTAGSTAGRQGVISEVLDRAQGLFGDPSGTSNFFMDLNDVFTDFAALANDPGSSLSRGQALTSLQSFFDDATRIATSMTQLQQETDTRIRSDVTRANDLLGQITDLNSDIRAARIGGADSSGAENIQSQLIDELSSLINVQVQVDASGGTVLRTQDGQLLADSRAATLTYNQSGAAAGYISVTPGGSTQTFDAIFTGGELVGLLEARNKEIPGVLDQLAEFTEGVAREINRAHNDNSTVPAPQTLTGKNTALDLPTAVGGFTGITTVAILNASGVITNRVQINFNTNQISLNGGGATTFDGTAAPSPTSFESVMAGKMAGIGTFSFTNGVMSIGANAGGGVAIVDDATAPSNKATQGFSQFFGLNDLVRSTALPQDTGLSGASPHGFAAGDTVTFRLTDPSGVRVRDVTVTVPGAGLTTMNDLLAAMNAPNSGVSPYGQFSLDGAGRMAFTSAASPAVTLSVVDDQTSRNGTGPSLTRLFSLGIGGNAEAASSFAINPTVYQDPSKMALARLDLAATGVALAPGDGRGALALSKANEQATSFGSAGGLPAANMTLQRYATEVAGSLGRRAAAAETSMESSFAIKAEAENRRSSYEGVNTDEELIKLTTYQQAFNASARLIQASNDLYDVLLNMVG